MLNRRFAVLVIVFVMLAQVEAIGVGKITVDPNLAPTQSTKDLNDSELLLAKKITYEARGKTVSSIINDLSTLTGVRLRAGLSENDWQVRDRKMNVFAKDIPAASIMNSIARVMKFKWRIDSKNNPLTYRLWMDRKTVLAQGARLQREHDKTVERRTSILDTILNSSDLQGKDLADLREKNPYLYALSASGTSGALKGFLDAIPSAKDAFVSRQELHLDAGSMSSNAQNALVGLMRSAWLIAPAGDYSFPEDAARAFQNERLTIDPSNNTLGVNLKMMNGGRNTNTHTSPIMMSFQLLDPSSPMAAAWGRYRTGLLDGLSEDQAHQVLNEYYASAQNKNDDSDYDEYGNLKNREDGADGKSIDPEPPSPDEPALNTKVVLNIKRSKQRTTMADYQCALADATNLAVVSDSFGESFRGGASSNAEVLRTALDEISAKNSYRWWKHGSVIEFRDNDWFEKRSLQIPEAWMQPWRDSCRKANTLDLEHLSEIANLTREQYDFNFPQDETLMNLSFCYPDDYRREFLDFYSSFNNKQWKTLLSKTGIDMANFSEAQNAALNILITNGPNSRSFKDMSAYKVRIGVTLSNEGKAGLCYLCTAYETGTFPDGKYHKDHPTLICGFSTPSYVCVEEKPADAVGDKKDDKAANVVGDKKAVNEIR